MELEFEHYDVERSGKIGAKDFAHSIVGATRLKHLDEYIDKARTAVGAVWV